MVQVAGRRRRKRRPNRVDGRASISTRRQRNQGQPKKGESERCGRLLSSSRHSLGSRLAQVQALRLALPNSLGRCSRPKAHGSTRAPCQEVDRMRCSLHQALSLYCGSFPQKLPAHCSQRVDARGSRNLEMQRSLSARRAGGTSRFQSCRKQLADASEWLHRETLRQGGSAALSCSLRAERAPPALLARVCHFARLRFSLARSTACRR